MLVPFQDPAAIADRVRALLDNEAERHAMRKRAYLLGRDSSDSDSLAALHAGLFGRCLPVDLLQVGRQHVVGCPIGTGQHRKQIDDPYSHDTHIIDRVACLAIFADHRRAVGLRAPAWLSIGCDLDVGHHFVLAVCAPLACIILVKLYSPS